MSLRSRLADWVALRLLRGERPGRAGLKLVEPDGARTTWVFDGDAVEVLYSQGGKGVHLRTVMTVANALSLSRFIARWWARTMWRGLKLRLWLWASRVRSEKPVVVQHVTEVPNVPRIDRKKQLNGKADGPPQVRP